MKSKHEKVSRRGAAFAAPVALALLAALAAPAPDAAADWLVTKEGARLETKGGWTVRGKLVVFTLPDGTLSSVRLDQVDLEASKHAEEAVRQEKERAAAAPVEKPKRKSVVSLTDKDFRKAPPAVEPPAAVAEGGEGAEGQAAPASAAPASAAAASALEVTDWERAEPTDGLDGIRLVGKVRNAGSAQAAGVTVVAMLFDESGTLIGQIPAELDTNLIPAGESASFVVNAPGMFSFDGVKFQVRGAPLKGQAPAAAQQPQR